MLGKRCSVLLFLRHIPTGVTRKELKSFVRKAVKEIDHRPFTTRTTVGNCSILCITDPERGTREYHGLVEVQPAPAAMQAIEILNCKLLRGRPIEAHRYRHRSPMQASQLGCDDGLILATVRAERRRTNIKIDLVPKSGIDVSKPSRPATDEPQPEGETDLSHSCP